ncbi:hypothetical protein [Pseudomonas helleri]|uniref:hypothetical protein n=1 Tax=Pseudomonas helleri TaxID=1608996 RepID=UPI0006549FA2|nr:hypothetical protein [Pseudomonas helleri]KMN09780.1 aspartate-semialdehyde dehydrogenase [Pseudomonas helleri]
MADTISLNHKLLDSIRADDYSGFDPFDSLNSKILKATPLYKSAWIRLAWLQFGKRSPVNFRQLLRVPKKRNPKGVGLFISGLIQDYLRTGSLEYLEEAKKLANWLLTERSDQKKWQHSCWGYHFDWQARAFYVPAGKPNIITTCYVARALYELGTLTADKHLIEIALDSAYFISKTLFTKSSGRSFYAYIPGETAFVHNASLWGAAWCAFAGKQLGDDQLVIQSCEVARQSVQEQSMNGSWVYGALHHHQFIDGFHTGYNLEALLLLRDATSNGEFDDCIQMGYDYYVNTFFTEDGTVSYYNNQVYPIDMHSVAQAIFTLLKVGGTKKDLELCEKIITRAKETLYLPNKGQFIYQKTRRFKNKINYTRWTQAWAYSSLAFYNRYRAEKNHAEN